MTEKRKSAYIIHPSTAVISQGYDPKLSVGSARPAVFRSSTYVFSSPEEAEKAFATALGKREPIAGENIELIYARLSHPNAEILETHLLSIEPESKAAAAFNSGMAAISSIFFTFTKPGRTTLFSSPIYGGTHHFIHEMLIPTGYNVEPFLAGDTEVMRKKIRAAKNLDFIFIETPSNPTLRMTDITACVEEAKNHPDHPLVIVDNTFMGPAFQHPLLLGADLTVYSATKFLSGFSDMLGGVILGSNRSHIQKLQGTRALLGNILQPDECWMLDSRLPMVNMRMNRASKNAELIVKELKKNSKISEILYPTEFTDENQIAIWKNQCEFAGSIFSIRLKGGKKAAFDLLRNLELIRNAVSLGGVESLACHPSTTTHSEMSPDDQKTYGLDDSLVRISVGIEDWADILQDIEQAMSA
jgi:methionine-gamma-lyase